MGWGITGKKLEPDCSLFLPAAWVFHFWITPFGWLASGMGHTVLIPTCMMCELQVQFIGPWIWLRGSIESPLQWPVEATWLICPVHVLWGKGTYFAQGHFQLHSQLGCYGTQQGALNSPPEHNLPYDLSTCQSSSSATGFGTVSSANTQVNSAPSHSRPSSHSKPFYLAGLVSLDNSTQKLRSEL